MRKKTIIETGLLYRHNVTWTMFSVYMPIVVFFLTFNHAGHFGALHRICQGDTNRKLGLAWPSMAHKHWKILGYRPVDKKQKPSGPASMPASSRSAHNLPRWNLASRNLPSSWHSSAIHIGKVYKNHYWKRFKKSCITSKNQLERRPFFILSPFWSFLSKTTTFLTEASALSQQSLVSQ